MAERMIRLHANMMFSDRVCRENKQRIEGYFSTEEMCKLLLSYVETSAKQLLATKINFSFHLSLIHVQLMANLDIRYRRWKTGRYEHKRRRTLGSTTGTGMIYFLT